MNWQPSSDVAAARRRAAMLQRIRQYFDEQDVLAVDTPALSACAVSDVQIESFAVQSISTGKPLFLQTSPEFNMKRLLAAGYPDIYSICRVFRDGEVGARHQPEFTMIEWYRHGMHLESIIADTVRLIIRALDAVDVSDNVEQVDYAEIFKQHTGINIFATNVDELAECSGADTGLRRSLGDDKDAWFDLLLSTKICGQFAKDKLTVLRHYPASQAALARLCPADERVADRFEVFLGPTELANGYVELTDAEQQLQRIEADQASRQQSGMPLRPHDVLLLAALQSGLPACAGVAVGLERLQMAHDKTDDISKVLTFAFENHHD